MALSTPPYSVQQANRDAVVEFVSRGGRHVLKKAGKALFPSSSSSRSKRGKRRRKSSRRSMTRSRNRVRTNLVSPSVGNYTYSGFKRFIKGRPYPRLLKLLYPPRMDRDVAGSVLTNGGFHDTQAVTYYSWADKQAFARPFDILDDAGVATCRGYIKSVSGSLEIANLSNVSVQLTLYDIVARRDLQGTDAAGDADTPTAAWLNVNDTGGSDIGGFVKSYTNINGTPFDSPEFCQKFKILRVTKAAVSTGTTHTHYVNFNLNWLLNKEYQQAYNGYRGKTHFTVVVAKGMPMGKVVTAGLVHTTVLSPVDLHIIKNQAVSYRGINNVQAYYQYDNNLSNDVTEPGSFATMVEDVEKVDFDTA